MERPAASMKEYLAGRLVLLLHLSGVGVKEGEKERYSDHDRKVVALRSVVVVWAPRRYEETEVEVV